MKFIETDTKVRVDGISELSAANYETVRDKIRTQTISVAKDLEIDLSQTERLDSCGLGALINLYKFQKQKGYHVKLVNPAPSVQNILELTRLHRIFEIIRDEEEVVE